MSPVSLSVSGACHSQTALKEAFLEGGTKSCLEIIGDLACVSGTGRHPAELLLPVAEAHDRRVELLRLTETLAQTNSQDCRLLELGAVLHMQLGHLREAETRLREALRRRPRHLPALSALALTLTQAGRFDEAHDVLCTMRDLDPGDPSALSNVAYLTAARGDVQGAINLYRQAIQLKPDHPQMRLNYSIALLKAGYFQQGWSEHEWRFRLPGHTSLPMARLLPNITPALDLRGKRVLVTQEEGYGDTFMYLRFLPLLAELGAVIRVWGADIMADLCARVPGVAEIQVGGETPEYDYHCPFISLPRAFSGTRHPFGRDMPYLAADPEKSARFAEQLAHDRALRVGLVWAGASRRDQTEPFMLDQRRSMPLETLQPLFNSPGVTLYSLQKGPAATQLGNVESGIVDLMDQCHSMDDTAALIDNLDMIVSVDTSVVHLAGGMNKPVLLMDRVNPCWRWLTDRVDSPWYPSLRIVRQTKAWDWSPVISSVRDILDDAARQKTS